MSIAYDEIIIKYVEGGMLKNLGWLIKNLESDAEVVAGASREKGALLKFLTSVQDQFDEFLNDGDDNRSNQDDKELFGDDDIVVGGSSGTQTDFMDPPTDGEDNPPDNDSTDKDNFDFGNDFDDGFPK